MVNRLWGQQIYSLLEPAPGLTFGQVMSSALDGANDGSALFLNHLTMGCAYPDWSARVRRENAGTKTLAVTEYFADMGAQATQMALMMRFTPGGNTRPTVTTTTTPTLRQQLLAELAQQGVSHTPENIVFIARTTGGRIIFLETGSAQAGLQHIIARHGADFAARGVSQAQIPALIQAALTEGSVVGTTGSGANLRTVYEVVVGGIRQRVAIGVGSNGFVVNAHPF